MIGLMLRENSEIGIEMEKGPMSVTMRPLCIFAAVIVVGLCASPTASSQAEKSETGFVSEDYGVSTVDQNGVDIISGSVRISSDLIGIGAGASALSYSVVTPSLAQTGTANSSELLVVGLPITAGGSSPFKYDSYSGGVVISGIDDCNNWFEIAGNRTDFCGTILEGLTPNDGSNATLAQLNGKYVFTSANGIIYYSDTNGVANRKTTTQIGLSRIEYPDGYSIEIHRGGGKVAIVDNRGFQIRITDAGTATANITAFNMAVDYCAPLASSCSFTKPWPTAIVYTGTSTNPAVATDMAGRQTKLYPRMRTNGFSGYQFYKVKPAGADEAGTITYTFCGPWFDTSCAAVSSCGPGTQHTAEVCKQFAMSANKVRTAQKYGKTWDYHFSYFEE